MMHEIPPTVILLTFLGTACFLFQYDGMKILTDPGDFFTGRLTEEKAGQLSGIDLILITHADFDHVNRLRFIPGISDIPVLGPCGAKDSFGEYRYLTDEDLVFGEIRIRKIKTDHGMRHDVPHTGFALTLGKTAIYMLGDGYNIGEALPPRPDYLFLTISGMESNIENGLKNTGILMPGTVIPMHWETLFRDDGKARGFRKAVEERYPSIRCIIPPHDQAINLECTPD
jgi:L-ascorbate metabolism protein UlaG (beta-lactamase superfamily)